MAAFDEPLVVAPTAASPFDLPSHQPLAVKPVATRSFDDVRGQRQAIYDSALAAVSGLEPIETDQFRLEVVDARYKGDPKFRKRDEKKALMDRTSVHRRLHGRVRLTDKATGEVLDEQETVLAHVPHMTERGVLINKGTPWLIKNQQRLRPGIYALRQQNGGLAAQFNVRPGSGRGFWLRMDPKTGIMKLKTGQSETRLYPLLRQLGVTDDQVKAAWGEQLFKKNWRAPGANDRQDIRKVVSKLGRKADKERPDAELPTALREILERSELDDEVTESTLGTRYGRASIDSLMDASRAMLAIGKGERQPDNRDSQAYQSFHSAEDFIGERIKLQAPHMLRKLAWKARAKRKLGNLQSGVLNDAVQSLYRGSGLAQAVEDTNPLETYDLRQAITRLGEGGISSNQAVPRAARGVQPSYFGLIDPIRAPEGQGIGVDMRVTDYARKGDDGRLYTRLRNTQTGEVEEVSALKAVQQPIAFPGELQSDRPYVRAIDGDDIVTLRKDQVQYEMPAAHGMSSRLSNMIPFLAGAKSQRNLMGVRMLTQALPLQDAEEPFVQTADEDGVSLYQQMGSAVGAVRSELGGKVTKVDQDSVTIRTPDGQTEEHDLYHYYPLARKTMLHNTPAVKVGDQVEPGGLVASSNFTNKQGVASPGRNLRVAYMVGEGGTYEDGFVISESAAKKLRSHHSYKQRMELDKDIHSTKTEDFLKIWPDKFKPEQVEKLDEEGVVKVGQTLEPGDPVIVAIGRKGEKLGGVVAKTNRSNFSDKSQTWEHHYPGKVTDVSRTRSGIKVHIESFEPMTLGSKLSSRYGNKGVISDIRPDSEMPQNADGEAIDVLVNSLGVVSRTNPSVLSETLLGKVARKTGKPYVLKPFDQQNIAQYALDEAKNAGVSELEELTDPRTGQKISDVFTGEQYMMRMHHTGESKLSARDTGSYSYDGSPAKGGYEGCFVAKQQVITDQGAVNIGHLCEKRLGLNVLTWNGSDWVYRPVTDWFVRRAQVSDIITVKYMGPAYNRDVFKKNSARSTMMSFSATKNHVVFTTNRGKVQAGDLEVGDRLVTRGVRPNSDQESALLGSLLGDSSITATTGCLVFQCEHSNKQREYVQWKQSLWAGLGARVYEGNHAERMVRGRRRAAVKSSTITWTDSTYLREWYDLFYDGGDKQVSKELAQRLDLRGVALWLLDDGWISNVSKKRGRRKLAGGFATDSFTECSVDNLRERLSELSGMTFGKTRLEKGFRITFSQRAAEWLCDLVAQYVPSAAIPRSKRVLRQVAEQIQLLRPISQWQRVNRLEAVGTPILSIDAYKHDKPDIDEVNVYDITVDETHSYCAGSALVSNSKRIAMLDTHALLSYGATEVLKDAKLIRGQRNDEYWRALKLGLTPNAPSENFANSQFRAMLKASGVNLRERQGKTQLAPMTDKDVDMLAHNEIKNGRTFDFDTMQPIEGGLFDKGATGGADGQHWAKIVLPTKIPNPMMEEPIIRMLGLTQKRFVDILGGKEQLDGKTGAAAIEAALGQINVDREIDRHKAEIKTGSKSNRDKSVKALNYLTGLKSMEVKPQDLMISRLPVLPAKYRPVIRTGKMDMVNDANYLYHDLLEARSVFNDAKEEFGDADEELATVYRAAKAVSGMTQPVSPKSQEQNVKGLLQNAIGVGTSPKFARFQRKVIGQSVDTVGRGVIAPDPDLDMDEVSIPQEMAEKIFRPFVIRRLVKRGVPAKDAVKAVKNQTQMAQKALEAEMQERPVYWNRAPSLHRYNYVGAYAKLSKGAQIGLPQATEGGANADHDGDQVNVHVPVSSEAVREVKEKMMPSKNLWHPASFDVHIKPNQDYLAGLYIATDQKRDKPAQEFATRKDAYRAFMRGEIGIADPVVIQEESDDD